jgi:uroporphyrinogen III methyltransferase/synthase
MSLLGKTVLITRAAHQADEMVRLVEQSGGTPILFPTIAIVTPDSWRDCDRAINGLYMYDGVIFTSTNGVTFFLRRLAERGRSVDELQSKTICVVGEKTKEAVRSNGLPVTTVPGKFTSLDLANALRQDNLHGKSFLFPKGNLAKDTLPEMLKSLGASVDPVTVYQTRPPERENVDAIRKQLFEGKINTVTFTSTSTFRNFAALFSANDLRRITAATKVASIGPVTTKAIEASGLDVDIQATQSTVESLIESIAIYFHSHAAL